MGSAKADPWSSDAEINSELKARFEMEADLKMGSARRSEVEASGLLCPSGKAENPINWIAPSIGDKL